MNRGLSLSMISLEIGGPGGAIGLPLLVLHHTTWSDKKDMSTFKGLGA